MRLRMGAIFLLLAMLVPVLRLKSKVVRVEVTSRPTVLDGNVFGDAGAYERITGRVYFSLPVDNPHNQGIVDLRNAVNLKNGEVEFSADFVAVRPKDARKGNGSMLLEVPNRGQPIILAWWTAAMPIWRRRWRCVAAAQRLHHRQPGLAVGCGGRGRTEVLCADCKGKWKDHYRPAARRSDAVEGDGRRFLSAISFSAHRRNRISCRGAG